MRILPFIEFCALGVGALAVVAGRYFSLYKGVSLGVFLIGAGILVAGLDSFFTRRRSFRLYRSAREGYAGLPAQIAGAMQILVGGLAVAAAYLLAAGTWESTLNALLPRPWPLLVPLGLLLAGSGALLMINPQNRSGAAWTLFVVLPRWALGLVLLLAGIAATGAGVWALVEPHSFARFTRLVAQNFDVRFAERWWRSAVAFLR